jgi:hypothetical protein
LTTESPSSEHERKSVLTNVFADVGWECPRILAAMENVSGVYFDRVSQIRMDRWTKGRTALIGDAAACVSLLAGEGTGLAMAEAYVLAGELHGCGGDHIAAFARYQQRMMPFLKRKQVGSEICFLVRPEEHLRHHVPQPCHPAIADSVHCEFPHRPRPARRHQAPRLRVLADLPHDILNEEGWCGDRMADGPDGTSYMAIKEDIFCAVEGRWDGGDDSDPTYVPSPRYEVIVKCANR